MAPGPPSNTSGSEHPLFCAKCAKTATEGSSLKRCSKCKTHYCSQECQEADWKDHKSVCKTHTSGINDIQQAIHIRQLVRRADDLRDSSMDLLNEYERTGNKEYLEDAIAKAKRAVAAVALTPDGHLDLARSLCDLGTMLSSRYRYTGKLEDLEDAITHTQRAVGMTPNNHPDMLGMLNNLGGMRFQQYQRTGRMEDLEASITNAQRVVHFTPDNDSNLAARLNNLGTMLSSRYERTGKIEDLEEAIANAQKAVNATPQDLAFRLKSWGRGLLHRFERTGKRDDLEEALTKTQRAVKITPQGHQDFADMLEQLSRILVRRFEWTGKTEDLEEAVTYAQRAVDETPQGHTSLLGMLNNLSITLFRRYERTSKREDLEEAIANARKTVDRASGRGLAAALDWLGSTLLKRYELTRNPKDLDDAITNVRGAVDKTPKDHPQFAGTLTHMGSALFIRYEWTEESKDLEDAITNMRRAVDNTPKDHPQLAGTLDNLGRMLSNRYKRTRNPKDRDEALKCYLKAYDSDSGTPLTRIRAARRGIQLFVEHGSLQEASSLADKAVKLLPMVCSRYLSRADQQHAVSQTAGLAADACSLSLRADNNSNRALEYLEHGRGLIIGYLIDGRGDISELRKGFPEKAQELDRLRYKIFMPIRDNEPPEVRRQLLREREAAATDLETCLTDIRELPNHDRFLLPPSSDDLKSCATDGPIVVVNVTDISSDALLVSTSEIEYVRLPGLDRSEIDMYRPWTLTRGATRDGKVVGKLTGDDKFREFLTRLWSSCVRLVLERLGICEPPSGSELPRIWWIGTGSASSLPFHAAGTHSIGSVANTLSCAISSYTPTIKALRHAREKAMADIDKHSVLLVTMAKTPGGRDLPGVEAEGKDISGVVKNPHSVQPLRQPSANSVLDRLKDFSIAHFACHGSADMIDPSNSFLALQGNSDSVPDKLTVQMISDANLGRAWLAYLSACSTAEIKVSGLADEALHLASSFQVAGFGHVVASMWPSNDAICAQIASLFYRDLLTRDSIKGGNRAVAAALHAAVAEVRSRNREWPYLWAQYIHSGA
jgi:tetratricopeptide (TPR) repeat protein